MHFVDWVLRGKLRHKLLSQLTDRHAQVRIDHLLTLEVDMRDKERNISLS